MPSKNPCALFSLLFFWQWIAVAGQTTEEYGSGSNPILTVYQRYISPAKGGNTCPMHPSCSQYAKLALQKNPGTGMLSIFDRFLRCGADGKTYVRHSETGKLYDPVDQRDCIRYSPGGFSLETQSILGFDRPQQLSDSLSFIQFLIVTGRFEEALHESNIELYNSLYQEDFETNLIQSGYLHLMINDFEGFLTLYNIFSSQQSLSSEKRTEFDLALSKCHYLAGHFQKSLSALSLIDTFNLSPRLSGELNFLFALNYLSLGQFESAERNAGRIPNASDRVSFAKKCLTVDSLLPSCRFRNPGLAGVFSTIIPGAGYAYCGRPGTAFVAVIINGLFIWTAAEAFTKKNYAIGATAAFLGSGWYFGNIFGAVKSAKNHNQSITRAFIRNAVIN
jgi:putative component of membrane protein insertase Oxa1/YidC/SpoIIIJ protein YidD